jgi:hypothetical protein
MKLRSVVSGALAAITATSAASPARALEIARITQRGYIIVDEPDALTPYEGRVPTGNTQDTLRFVAELSQLIADTPNAPRGRYVAVMQTSSDQGGALAFYLGMSNNVRGIGQRSPINNRDETFNLNPFAGTAFPITGFVWLNNYRLYLDGFSDFGKYLICTQEFGHRWGTVVRVPPQPTGRSITRSDGGVEDASAADASADASEPDATVMDPDGGSLDAGMDDAGDASADASADASVPMGPPLLPTALLGRQTAHWSYFVHSLGSPMEGNNWSELTPGVFRAGRPTFKFHPMDLYIMGLLAPEDVTPTFLIAEPNTMGQRDRNGQPINPSSTPEFGDRTISIRGRRVTFGIEDIIRANGPRVPAAVTVAPLRAPDGGMLPPPDGGAFVPRENDMDVVWVLLTTSDRVGDRLVRDFDRAVDECADGYSYATDGRSVLLPRVAPQPVVADAGTDASADATAEASVDAGVTDGAIPDSALGFTLGGGCACRAAPGLPAQRDGARALSVCAALAALACVSASRRRRRT